MELITFLQSTTNQSIIAFFKIITMIGNEEFYLLALPILLWNWNKDSSKRLFILFLSGMLVAVCIKGITQIPRPQDIALIEADGFSFPSGHAVGAVIFWGFLAWSIKKTWFIMLSSILIILISLSRIVLGVHWPIDILGGATLGTATLAANYLFNRINVQLGSVTWISLSLLLVISMSVSFLIQTEDVATLAGLLLGVGWGLVIEENYISMRRDDSFWKSFFGTLFGCIVVIILWAGLKRLFPNTLPFRFVRYTVIGYWVALGAPYFLTLTRMYARIGSKPVLRSQKSP